MDKIRVSKVAGVSCTKSGSTSAGTLHLTAHHLIFQSEDKDSKEMWVPFPLMSLVTRLAQTLQGLCPITIHTRTFESFSLSFQRDSDASDVFESVKELTVAPSVYQLYAFFYTPNPPFPRSDGWKIYSPREEFTRMGVGTRSKAWRYTNINKDYSFCPTYPAKLVVPTKISDTTLQYASKYRSKCRIPVLSYLHWSGYGSITRSSQPMVGITQNRSVQDEKLIEAIFQSHHNPESRVSAVPTYGATATNLIIDARPTANAMANTAKGAGTENMDHYREGKKLYLGIDHIHTMRESLAKVVDVLREADILLSSISDDLATAVTDISVIDRQALRRSGWLRHITAIIEGTLLIVRNVHVSSSHVLIHCSDGWDRTSQLSALAQLCLDPFYRTIRGFEILIEKDWLSYGHKFLDRCGHLSSDKFFVSPSEPSGNASNVETAQAFFASVQNRFTSQNHIKETSPVFHQFLESVRQIQRQLPERFEFNERFLRQLYLHLYSCQFGTFLFNCERDRRVGDGRKPPCERTVSVWDFFNSPTEMEQNRNPDYNPALDDPASRVSQADMGVLLPNPKDVRFWNELYGRTDEEMNGRLVPLAVRSPEIIGPVDGARDDPVIRMETPASIPLPPSPGPSQAEAISPSQSMLSPSPSRSEVRLALTSDFPSSRFQEPSTPTPRPIRQDSFKPYGSSSSAFSLQPTITPLSSSPSPRRLGGDLFASSNARSMWDKLSSNAAAAFSVVQEAYEGATKDIRTVGPPGSSVSPNHERELSNRTVLQAWGEEPSKAASYASGSITSNPWASSESTGARLDDLSITDNPWGSVRSSASSTGRVVPAQSGSNPLESSPTSQPAGDLPQPIIHSPIPQHQAAGTIKSTRSSSLKSEPPPTSNTDPLGVGPL